MNGGNCSHANKRRICFRKIRLFCRGRPETRQINDVCLNNFLFIRQKRLKSKTPNVFNTWSSSDIFDVVFVLQILWCERTYNFVNFRYFSFSDIVIEKGYQKPQGFVETNFLTLKKVYLMLLVQAVSVSRNRKFSWK